MTDDPTFDDTLARMYARQEAARAKAETLAMAEYYRYERETHGVKPKPEKPKCGAKTRKGTPCKRKALENGRCPNHGGMSTGPRTKKGRKRIAATQRKRWKQWRAEREKTPKFNTSQTP